jgi:hypothetical protein
MDLENEKTDPQYVRRFNEGYILAKYAPELFEKLSKTKNDRVNLRALQDGRQQFLSEHVKDKLPDWLKNDRPSLTSKTSHKDKGMDMDSRE